MIAHCHSKSLIIQLGIKGHVIIYPQSPTQLLNVLPPTLDDVVMHICLRDKAIPLVVRKEKVRKALEWLKTNNPLYSGITIDVSNLNQLHSHFIPPFDIQLVHDNENMNTLVHELCGAALKHFKQNCLYLQYPHEPIPANEFNNPSLLPMTYPTLFPYGIGGPENSNRSV
ncbi:hypothetical protein BDQ17DRAFT_1386702 [Cyathus striatus]|nr:hypothetical protein BDQ17DRAFT_1386702 [Cyathus striatus]